MNCRLQHFSVSADTPPCPLVVAFGAYWPRLELGEAQSRTRRPYHDVKLRRLVYLQVLTGGVRIDAGLVHPVWLLPLGCAKPFCV